MPKINLHARLSGKDINHRTKWSRWGARILTAFSSLICQVCGDNMRMQKNYCFSSLFLGGGLRALEKKCI